MPTQARSARGKKITEWLKMKVSRITLRWPGLKSIKWVWKPGDSPREEEEWRWKEDVNEEKQPVKIQKQNEDQKWNEEQQLTSQKPLRRFSQAK